MVTVIIDNFNERITMKIVNPTNGKPIPLIAIDKPFMLRCPYTGAYYKVVITTYGTGPYTNGYKYVIKDNQSSCESDRIIKVFTVRCISTGRDLYKSLDEVVQLITSNDYAFTHIG